MTYSGSEYFYLANLQGDVTGLADAAGTTVVSYTYDTWGKLMSTTDSMATTLGVKNPYCYRGYRYDTETGLYYLQSRYYNPEIGLFINADSVSILNLVQGSLLSPNLFTYCNNNPVNSSDPTGYMDVWTIVDIAFTLAGVGWIFKAKRILKVLYWSGRLIQQFYQFVKTRNAWQRGYLSNRSWADYKLTLYTSMVATILSIISSALGGESEVIYLVGRSVVYAISQVFGLGLSAAGTIADGFYTFYRR